MGVQGRVPDKKLGVECIGGEGGEEDGPEGWRERFL